MFDWDDLKPFLATAREGSAQGAARLLNLNPTTIARRLEALEHRLGLKLFARAPVGVRLTPAGEVLLAEAERMEAAARALQARAEALRRGLGGVLKVTTLEAMANLLIMPGLRDFGRLYPDIRVDLVVTDETLDLEAGEADVAVRAGMALPLSDLVARKIVEFDTALYGSWDYVRRKGVPSNLEDLRRHDLIGAAEGSLPIPAVRWLMDQLPGVAPVARCNSLTTLEAALRGGVGIAPYACLAVDLDPDLVRLLPPFPEMRPAAWLVTTRAMRDAPHVRAFIDFMIPFARALHRDLLARGEAAQAEKAARLAALTRPA